MIGGVCRPTKILIYTDEIIMVRIQVRKTIPIFLVRFMIVRAIAISSKVEVSPKSDKLITIKFNVLFPCNTLKTDEIRSSRTEVASILTNKERATKTDINKKKRSDRTGVHPIYPTDLLDNIVKR
jgi:regulatory protein YycI of two-component signal transduction system YycFG